MKYRTRKYPVCLCPLSAGCLSSEGEGDDVSPSGKYGILSHQRHTKNGRGSYVLMDIEEYEKTQATLYLLNDLTKGKKSGEEKGWVSSTDVRAHFRAKANEV